MRVLCASDLHGEVAAYEAFARCLETFDLGIIAGDLMEEFITAEDAVAYGLRAVDFVEELQGDDFDEVAGLDRAVKDALENPQSVNRRGLEAKRRDLAAILSRPGKPVLLVKGNHDLAAWRSEGLLVDLEGRRLEVGGWAFYGVKDSFVRIRSTFRYTSRLKALRKLVWRTHPRFCVFGHVHEGFGWEGPYVNAAWPKERRFLALDLEAGTVEIVEPGLAAPSPGPTALS